MDPSMKSLLAVVRFPLYGFPFNFMILDDPSRLYLTADC